MNTASIIECYACALCYDNALTECPHCHTRAEQRPIYRALVEHAMIKHEVLRKVDRKIAAAGVSQIDARLLDFNRPADCQAEYNINYQAIDCEDWRQSLCVWCWLNDRAPDANQLAELRVADELLHRCTGAIRPIFIPRFLYVPVKRGTSIDNLTQAIGTMTVNQE